MSSETLSGPPHPRTTESALLGLHQSLCSIQSEFPGCSGGIAQQSWFICSKRLYALLSHEYTLDVLRAIFRDQKDDGVLTHMAESIIDNECCKIFAILAVSGSGHRIQYILEHSNDYRDSRLPLQDIYLSKLKIDTEALAMVSQLQRHFCVEAMRLKRFDSSNFSEDIILPVKKKEFLKSGSTAEVYKVELHAGYADFKVQPDAASSADSSTDNSFVLKTFDAEARNAREYYEREVRAYTRIASDKAPELNLIGYYGSFLVRDAKDRILSYNIMLEHANGRTLADLFEDPKRECPATSEAFWTFWHQLLGIARGLDRLHVFRKSEGDNAAEMLQGMHHDLKPDNILVLEEPDPEFKAFPFRFVIADLGLVTMHSNEEPDGMIADRRANTLYGAPETHRASWRDDWHMEVGPSNDVWALGCVLSEAFVWSMFGFAGLDNYRDARKASSGGRGPVFHDGHDVLDVVTEQHDKCVRGTRQGDRLAEKVASLLEVVLVPERGRLTAMQIVERAKKILAQTRPVTLLAASPALRTPPPPKQGMTLPNRLIVSEPNTRTPSVDVHSPSNTTRLSARSSTTSRRAASGEVHDSGSVISVAEHEEASAQDVPQMDQTQNGVRSQPPPSVTMTELRQWKDSIKNGEPMSLPQMTYLDRLDGRDTIFVIDDSRSMKKHWPAVKDWLGLVAWTLKRHDPDDLEFCFLSGGKIHTASTTKSLLSKVQLHSMSSPTPTTNAETRLENLFHEYVEGYRAAHDRTSSRRTWPFQRKPSGRPINYYVLTDGRWEPESCNVSNALLRLLSNLETASSYQVGISFIRFGHEQIGINRLNALDDGMIEVKGAPRDIVDHEPWDGNVLKMLLAPTNPWWDGLNEPSEDEKARWRWN